MKQHDTPPQRTTVVDDNIGDYTKPELFFRLASAYADSSHQIVRSMLAGDLPQTFAHAQTIHFLFAHAVELFLKGAILKSTDANEKPRRKQRGIRPTRSKNRSELRGIHPTEIETHHHLQPLYNRYRNLYPKKKFDFTGRIVETVKENPKSPHSEFPRYPVDRKGNVWEGYNAYTLEMWLTETEQLREDFERLISQIDPLPQPAFSA